MKYILVIAFTFLAAATASAQSEYIHDDGTGGHVLKVRQAVNNGDYLYPVHVLDVTDDDNDGLLRVFDFHYGVTDGPTVEALGFIQTASGFRIGMDYYNDASCTNCTSWTRGAGAPSSGACDSSHLGSLYSRVDAPDDSHLFYVCGVSGWVAK
jgi:hypothetical protein